MNYITKKSRETRKVVIEGLVKAKRAYYTKYNRIVDY